MSERTLITMGALFLVGLILILWWTSYMVRWLNSGYNREEVSKMINTDELIRACPYCGGSRHTWGTIASRGNQIRFTSLNSDVPKRVIASRCNHCGHIANFVIIKTTDGHKSATDTGEIR